MTTNGQPQRRKRVSYRKVVFHTWDNFVLSHVSWFPRSFVSWKTRSRHPVDAPAMILVAGMTDQEWHDTVWALWEYLFLVGGNGLRWTKDGKPWMYSNTPPVPRKLRVNQPFPKLLEPRSVYPVSNTLGDFRDICTGTLVPGRTFRKVLVEGLQSIQEVGVLSCYDNPSDDWWSAAAGPEIFNLAFRNLCGAVNPDPVQIRSRTTTSGWLALVGETKAFQDEVSAKFMEMLQGGGFDRLKTDSTLDSTGIYRDAEAAVIDSYRARGGVT